MMSSNRLCDVCMKAFDENEKLEHFYVGSNYKRKPCQSTYRICKEADRFIKVQFLRQKNFFNAASYAISQKINVNTLYTSTDFSHNLNHKLCLIEIVVNTYIQIKSTYLAKQANFTREEENVRARLHELIHFYGQ